MPPRHQRARDAEPQPQVRPQDIKPENGPRRGSGQATSQRDLRAYNNSDHQVTYKHLPFSLLCSQE
jgi:hypothetical protein